MAAVPSAAGETRRFPYGAVLILALTLTVNSYTLTNLFPYVGVMIKHLLGLATTNEAGFYAGYVASAFTFGRFLSGYAWGHGADAFGRKPVILVGLSAVMVLSVVFGLSTSFTMAVVSRLVLGLLNGIMPAVRTMVREICGTEHVVKGMAYVTGSRGVGLVLGTGIGGMLAQPALYYPSVFSATGVFGKYPFLLPNLFGAFSALVMFLLVLFRLPETRNFSKPPAAREQSKAAVQEASSTSTNPRGCVDSWPKIKRRGSLAYQAVGDDGDASWEEKCSHEGRGGGLAVTATTTTTAEPSSRVDETEVHVDAEGKGEVGLLELTGRAGGKAYKYDVVATTSAEEVASGGIHGDSDGGGGGGGLTAVVSPQQGPPAEEEDIGVSKPGGLFATPKLKTLLLVVCAVQLVSIGFDEAYPLWALSTPDVGGLGWGSKEIGQVLSVTGIFIAVFQLGIVPHAVERVGIVNWQRAGLLMGIPVFLAVPNAKFFSWDQKSLFAVSVLSNLFVTMCVSSIMLALTVASTSIVPPHHRGKLGGVFMTAESLGRFLGPAGFSTTFAWSISTSIRWINCHFVFVVSSIVFAVISALSWRTFTLETLMKPAGRWGEGTSGGSTRGAAVGGDNTENEVELVPFRNSLVEKGGDQSAAGLSPKELKTATVDVV